ncbi:MAG TPA: hypothetical protein VHB21_26300 [Minicystis sp.]|nr:hypothetical protein [Minicystis sp.]
MGRTVALVLAAAALVACGARSELLGGGEGGAGTASASSAASSSSSSSGAGGAPCVWAFDGPWVRVPGHAAPWDAAADGDHLVVSFADQGSFLRVLSDDLASIGPPIDVGETGLFALSFGFGRRDVIGGFPDAQGRCASVALDAADQPTAPPAAFGGERCFWATPTPGGALVFSRPDANGFAPVDAIALDPGAHVVGSTPGAIAADPLHLTLPLGRVALDDASVMVFWIDGGSAFVRRFSPTGSPLFGPKPIFDEPVGDVVFAGASVGGSALVAWFHPYHQGEGPGRLMTAVAAGDGTLGAPHTLAEASNGDAPEGIDVVRTSDGALVLYGALGGAPAIVAQPVDGEGAPSAPSLTRTLAGAGALRVVRAVATSARNVVVLAWDDDQTARVTRLVCGP